VVGVIITVIVPMVVLSRLAAAREPARATVTSAG
jgi:hypothetical protein